MKITKAYRVNTGDHVVLCLETDQGTAYVEPVKPQLLRIQAALLTGPDVDAGKIEVETVAVPMDLRDSRPQPLPVIHCTTDLVAMELARRWMAGLYESAAIGEPVPVPTWEEADAAVWPA